MEIKKELHDHTAILSFEGWLDTQTAPELATALEELEDDVTSLEFDFAELEYVSSAGIRQIVAAHKSFGGKLIVRNVSPEVREILRLTGIANRLNFA